MNIYLDVHEKFEQPTWIKKALPEGDILIEGRFGNSIRLSSTISGGKYSIPAPWTGQVSGDPIIVLSNGRKYKKDSYTVENAEQDGATVYLTSTQKVPVLLGNSNKRNPLRLYVILAPKRLLIRNHSFQVVNRKLLLL